MFCCLILIVSLSLLTKAKSQNNNTLSLMLNGHYIRWVSSKQQEKFINDKLYVPKNIIYTRFQLCSDRVFLTAPRYKRGIPFTLGYAMLTNGDRCFNYVRAFPSIESQEIGKGSRESSQLFNVVDIYLGQDGTLWALDVGIYETLSDHPIRENDPKVVGFDISTGKVKYVISLRSLSCLSRSRLQYIVVEYLKESTTVLYIGDGGTRSIIVWYVESNEGYRIKLPHIVIQGCSELPHEDVFYIALIELCTGNYIYFSYLSSSDLYRVRTKDLRRQMNPRCIVNIGKKPCKMVFLGVGYETVLYFRIRGQNHLYSWDSRLSFLEENFMVVRKSKDCRAITHVDVDNVGTLWVLESNIQDYLMGHVGCYGPNMMLGPVLGDPIPVWSNCNEEEKC